MRWTPTVSVNTAAGNYLAYAVVLEGLDWKIDALPETTDDWIQIAMFLGTTALLSIFAFVVPIILNLYILGWPFYRRSKKPKKKNEPVKKVTSKKDLLGRDMVDVGTFVDKAKELDKEIERVQGKADVGLGSLATHELRSNASPTRETSKRINAIYAEQRTARATTAATGLPDGMQSISELRGSRSANGGRQPLSRSTVAAVQEPPRTRPTGRNLRAARTSRLEVVHVYEQKIAESNETNCRNRLYNDSVPNQSSLL
jgi:hypothetical protein